MFRANSIIIATRSAPTTGIDPLTGKITVDQAAPDLIPAMVRRTGRKIERPSWVIADSAFYVVGRLYDDPPYAPGLIIHSLIQFTTDPEAIRSSDQLQFSWSTEPQVRYPGLGVSISGWVIQK